MSDIKTLSKKRSNTLEWCGEEWETLGSDDGTFSEPGPNYWSPRQVKIINGYLVLKIGKIINSQGEKIWVCPCVKTSLSKGYGLYVWELASRVDSLDSQVVAGFFLGQFEKNNNNWEKRHYDNIIGEIDIEFSRWGEPYSLVNAQYLTQPWELGNIEYFNLMLYGYDSRHDILWTPNDIIFTSYHGHPTDRELRSNQHLIIKTWKYSGPYNPPEIGQKVYINLWLHKGKKPKGDGEKELKVSSFRYLPLCKLR